MRVFAITLTLFMSVDEVKPMPSGILEWYNTVQNFMGTLHEVLQVGAKTAQEFDPQGAQKIRDLEYNWLSLIGYYKGITPLLMDFYFHYLDNSDFEKANGQFVRTLDRLIASFGANAKADAIYKLLHSLTSDSLKKQLFQEGAIHSLLIELDEIVQNKKVCIELIRHAQAKASSIVGFLNFLMNGSAGQKRKGMDNSEL
jgi:hypothetical protein